MANNQSIYVSSSYTGSIENGTSSCPFKKISTAIAAASNGDTLFLKCGDTFEITASINLHTKHLSINKYGSGAIPCLSGFGSFTFRNAIVRDSAPNVWKFAIPSHNTDDPRDYSNIGFLYNHITDQIVFGKRVFSKDNLTAEGCFYQQGSYVYFYKNGSSFGYSTLKVAYHITCFEFLSNCTVKNIRIEGFGVHGFSGTSINATIRNVEIDLIGGCKFPSGTNRYGNGIEIWISKETTDETSLPHDVLVENCKVSRTYDAGCTLQGEVKEPYHGPGADNIVFSNNIITNCRQSFECFVRYYDQYNVKQHNHHQVSRCRFEKNQCFNAGDNQFGKMEYRDCHLYGGTTGMQILNNVFVNGGFWYRFNTDQTFVLRDNTCVTIPQERMEEGTIILLTEETATSNDSNNHTYRITPSDYEQPILDYKNDPTKDDTGTTFVVVPQILSLLIH